MSYAVIDESVGRRTDPYCYRLYGFLDQRQVTGKSTRLGIRAAARGIGWSRNTVREHLQHLEQLDLTETLKDRTIAVKTNTVRHRAGGPAADPPSARELTHPRRQAPQNSAGQTMRSGPAADPPPANELLIGGSGNSRDALATQPQPRGEGSDKRVARATVDGDGRLGSCDVCGKRWVFGPCKHKLEAVS